VGHILRMKCLL